jgi:hypothetical protein
MAQFMADDSDKEAAVKRQTEVYHEGTGGVWSPDMVEKRTKKESQTAIETLKELADLKEQGVITEEEFEQSKRKLLKKI